MARRAQQVFLGAIPVSRAPPMDPLTPIPENCAVALAAQSVTLIKADQRAVGKAKPVSIRRVVAIETPPGLWSMIENNIVVHILKDSFLGIGFHVSMTLGTRENTLGKRRWRHHERIAGLLGVGGDKLIDRRILPFDLGEIFR